MFIPDSRVRKFENIIRISLQGDTVPLGVRSLCVPTINLESWSGQKENWIGTIQLKENKIQ